jgi:transcriptional antiterminator
MKKAIETLSQIQKSSENVIHRSVKKITSELENLIVHKTQTERRKAFFGEDPLMRVN